MSTRSLKSRVTRLLAPLASATLFAGTLVVSVTVPAQPAMAAETSASRAVSWAISQLGSTSYDVNGGLCQTFVHDAYKFGAGIEIGQGYGTALNYWNQHSGKHPGDTNPPVGALVYWGATATNSAGHVGISEGGDYVISSTERGISGVHRFKISARNAAGYPYLGWMMPPGVADPGSQTYFRIRNFQHGRCLDVDPSANYSNGSRVYLWDCHNGHNQQWYYDGERLRSRASGRCLDADTYTINGNGTKVQVWDCTLANNQRWWDDIPLGPLSVTVRNRWSPRCLDGDTLTSGNGSKLHLWDCHSGNNQKFHRA